jgi:hypothetical protein
MRVEKREFAWEVSQLSCSGRTRLNKSCMRVDKSRWELIRVDEQDSARVASFINLILVLTTLSANNTIVSFRCTLTTVDMDAGVKRHDGEPFKTLKRWLTSIFLNSHTLSVSTTSMVSTQYCVNRSAGRVVNKFLSCKSKSSHKPFTPSSKSSQATISQSVLLFLPWTIGSHPWQLYIYLLMWLYIQMRQSVDKSTVSCQSVSEQSESVNHSLFSYSEYVYLKVMIQDIDRSLCLEISLLSIFLGQFMLEMKSLFLLNSKYFSWKFRLKSFRSF